jgi:undecaprenyl-diphosphatase
MTPIDAILVALLQGATELFPVSSLGHAVVVPAIAHWSVNQSAPEFLPFLVMLHVGTAVALLLYFWRDWRDLARGVLGLASSQRVSDSRRAFLLIVVATIPAVIVGGALEHALRRLFAAPAIAAAFLVVNGLLLLVGERLRTRTLGHRPLSELTVKDAFAIGCWQCAALIPGISRSGATIVGGLMRGIDHEASARFSFLIATPIIIAATVLEVPKLLHAEVAPGVFSLAALAAVVAGITAFLSTAFLMRYFRRHDDWALNPFAYYCIVAGIAAFAWLTFAG